MTVSHPNVWYNSTMSNRKSPTNPFKGMKKPKVTVVEENPGWGLYAWRKENGQLFMDDDHNLLNIPSRYGDITKMEQISKAAAHYGEPEGEARVYSRRTTAPQTKSYSEQVNRMKERTASNHE